MGTYLSTHTSLQAYTDACKIDVVLSTFVWDVACRVRYRRLFETWRVAYVIDVCLRRGVSRTLSTFVWDVACRVRSSNEDICDMTLHVTPVSRVGRVERRLDDLGYGEGPRNSVAFRLREGDTLELAVRGNVTPFRRTAPLVFRFYSQLPTAMTFYLVEVDKYRQRDYDTYRGYVQLYKRTPVGRKEAPLTKRDDDDQQQEAPLQYERILLCEQMVNVPKVSFAGPVDQDQPTCRFVMSSYNYFVHMIPISCAQFENESTAHVFRVLWSPTNRLWMIGDQSGSFYKVTCIYLTQ